MPHTSRPMSSCFEQRARRRRAPACPRCPAPSIPCRVALCALSLNGRRGALRLAGHGSASAKPASKELRARSVSRCIRHCFSSSLSSFSVCCLSWARILCKICLLASTRNILRPPPPAQRQQEYSAPHIQKRRHHPSSCSGYLPLLRALAIPGHIEAIEEPSPLVASLIGSMQPTWVLGGQLDQAFSFT
jgi:hypothetical protein